MIHSLNSHDYSLIHRQQGAEADKIEVPEFHEFASLSEGWLQGVCRVWQTAYLFHRQKT